MALHVRRPASRGVMAPTGRGQAALLRLAALVGLSLLLPADRCLAISTQQRSGTASEKVRAAAAWLSQCLDTQPAFDVPEPGDSYSTLSVADQDIIQDAGSYLEPYNGYSDPKGKREAFLLRNAELAVKGVELVNASGEVTQELFLRDVLPFRHFDEPVDNWRPVFFEKLKPLVGSATDLKSAAEAVIPQIFSGALGKPVVFKGNSTPQVMAPLTEVLEKGYASCTGISIFMADALRAVGIPARVVGTPEWNISTGGNHNWVEVYWGGQWHFVDGSPSSSVEWDRTWFLDNAQKAVPGTYHGIYTPVVDPAEADAKYLITWREPAFEMQAKDRSLFYKSFRPNPKVGADGKEDAAWRHYREASEGTR
mmetsp:Transcript_49350/g.152183  ORF Transcript_49350/g.152183 Transcript_49350/m.152183 type:complete len:367 (-) Transcript_49350:26-1126(-)